ncbi:lamin tail domain-containing protein [Candidatus Woesearchaeota archaeon]|nr:lamin tail domain-containing protein [Candidatus Woesearchaeota archaeon]
MIILQKTAIFFIFSLFLVNIAYAEIQITEVMFDPNCSDSYCEYIELYNNASDSVNITSWTIGDLSSNDTLEEAIIPSYSFALITDQDSRIYNYYTILFPITWIYVDDSSIGSGLGTPETISLYDESLNLIDQMNYSGTTNGDSLSLVNGIFQQSTPTPGSQNEDEETADYSKISVTEFLPNPEGDDGATTPNGEWIELYNSGNLNLDLIGLEFYDNVGSDPDIIVSNTSTLDGTIITSNSYKVVYTNGISSFLNNDGYEKITLKDIFGEIIDEITYSDSDEGVSWSLSEGKWQRTTPTPGYKNEDNKTSTQSELKIEEIYDLGSDKKAEWGDIIRPKIFAYKGNTNKEVVWIWIENDEVRVTKKSKFDLYQKFQNTTLTYPLMIPDNCNSEFLSGNYKLIVDGLDARDEAILEIRDKPLCKDSEKAPRVSNLEYSFSSISKEVVSEEKFTTEILLKNNLDEEINLDLWSYPYFGSQQYVVSDEKENLQKVSVMPKEEKVIKLENILPEVKRDTINFKVKLQKEGLKTAYELKETLKVKQNSKPSETLKNPITGYTVYESSGEKTKRSAIFIFNGLLVMLFIFVLIKNGT